MAFRKTTEVTNHLALGWVFRVQVWGLSPIFWNQLWKEIKKKFIKVNIINNTYIHPPKRDPLSNLFSDISYSFLQYVLFIIVCLAPLNTPVLQLTVSVITPLMVQRNKGED